MNIAARNSHKTAIVRNKVSRPTKYLLDNGLIKGKILDFGCGRGFDADKLGFDKYDPYYFPREISKKYDTIICNFVLNTLEKKDREKVLRRLGQLLKVWGNAFITVRREIKKEGYTKIGTYQENVILDLPIVIENGQFCIYRLEK